MGVRNNNKQIYYDGRRSSSHRTAATTTYHVTKYLFLLLIVFSCCVHLTDGDGVKGSSSDATTATTITCPSICQNRTATNSNDKEKNADGSARIAYLIIIHNNRTLHDAVHLFRSIRDEKNLVLIHIDKKAEYLIEGNANTPLHKEIQDCPCGCQTIRIESVHDVKWSHWSMLLPTLWGMEVATKEYWGQWDVFINLSGDTLPVYTSDTLATMLQDLPYNFVTSSSCETGLVPTSVYHFPSWWHKRAHYTHGDTEPDPVFTYTEEGDQSNDETTREAVIVTHFGSQWMILQADFCHWLVHELDNQNSLPSQYRRYLIDSGKLMTDETFIPSLIMQQSQLFNTTLPRVDDSGYLMWKNGSSSTITDIRYERMDEHVPTAFGYYPVDQRYEVPDSSIPSLGKLHPWGPYFLGVYDLANVRQSGALFVRKVSIELDSNMVSLLPVRDSTEIPLIQWPREVSISEKPDWEKKRAELLAAQEQETNRKDDDYEEEDEEL